MTDRNIKGALNRGLAWVGLAASWVALLDILSLVLILKFWIEPEEYGIATTVVTLFGALELAAEMGLSAAVIQRDDHTVARLSTIFWMNILFGLLFYGAVFLAAPLMARLHGHAVITLLFQVYGINLVLKSGYSLHQALLKRELRFKELSLIRILANLADFAVKLATAIAGYGVWCFVWGVLSRSLIFAIGVPLCSRWRPRLSFRPRETLVYIKFGLRSSAGEILFQIYSNLDYQVVSIFFGATALGFYRAAYELVLEPVKFISGVVVGVAFPAFSRLKTDMKAVIEQYIDFTRQNLIVVLSLVAFILLTAEEMLAVIIRPEYASAGNVARILAIVGVLRALSYIGPPLLDGLGRPELTLRYQTTAAIVLTAFYFLAAHYLGDDLGYLSVAIAWASGYPIAFLLLSFIVFSMLDMAPLVYLRRVAGILGCVAAGAAIGFMARWAVSDLLPVARLVIVIAATVVAIAVFLAYFQKITLTSVVRAMKK